MNIDETLDNQTITVLKMGDLVINQHTEICRLFKTKDKKTAVKIIRQDEYVNNLEEEINNQAIAAFALLGPVATDLRRVVVAVKISSALERIGDYAKSLAEFIIKNEKDYDNLLEYATQIEKRSIIMLGNAMQAYKTNDLEKAFELPRQAATIDTMYNELKQQIVGDQSLDIEYVFYLSKLLRNIERTKSYSINICEDIIYMIKGIHYDFD